MRRWVLFLLTLVASSLLVAAPTPAVDRDGSGTSGPARRDRVVVDG